MVRSVTAFIIAIFAALVCHSAFGRGVELLDFTSPTCGPCQQMAPTISSLISAGYPIRKIDVTQDPQTANRYKVEYVPVLIMLVDGQVVERVDGGTTGPRIEGMFQRANAELKRREQDSLRLQSPDRVATNQAGNQPSTFGRDAGVNSVAWPGTQRQPDTLNGAPDSPRLTQARSDTPRPQPNDLRPSSAFDPPAAFDPRFAALLNTSVRLRVDDEKGHSFGTGTIIDTRQGEALIITCGHLFRDTKGQGPVNVEMFEATSTGVRSAGQVAGSVISYDLERDVALVAIRPGRQVSVATVAPPKAAIQRGDRVVSIGCSNGQDPTALTSRITSLDRYQGAPNIEASGPPVEGRSGGGLFNQDGQLVGICFAADHEGNEGLYAALKAIHDELNVRGLSDVFMPRNAAPNTDVLASRAAPANGPVIRGQDPGMQSAQLPRPGRELARTPAEQLTTPASLTVPITSSPSPPPAGLSATEQAAWEEIMNRAASSEVICIIRPKQPGGQSEVITLDNVSPEFVRALANRNGQQPATQRR